MDAVEPGAMPDDWTELRRLAGEADRAASIDQSPMTAIPLTALEQQREDQALGAAWRRCEAALPEGWSGPRLGPSTAAGWRAVVWSPTDIEDDEGPTPTAALEALADRLEAGNG